MAKTPTKEQEMDFTAALDTEEMGFFAHQADPEVQASQLRHEREMFFLTHDENGEPLPLDDEG